MKITSKNFHSTRIDTIDCEELMNGYGTYYLDQHKNNIFTVSHNENIARQFNDEKEARNYFNYVAGISGDVA